jgi:hypothetical protein
MEYVWIEVTIYGLKFQLRFVGRMRETRNEFKILIRNPEGKRLLGRSKRRWKGNPKVYDRRCEVVD